VILDNQRHLYGQYLCTKLKTNRLIFIGHRDMAENKNPRWRPPPS